MNQNQSMHGLLPVDKPVGPTSMDVVRVVRRAAGRVKTGHAGTLDPLASGVVVCCLGRATKISQQLMVLTKVYEAEVDFSAFSTTDDAEGPLQPVEVTDWPNVDQVQAALLALTGRIQQTPPAHSAVKVGGRRAYKLARQGKEFTIQPREVRIDRIELLDYAPPRLTIRVTCGKGTYIRSLARQIGTALGVGGYLTALRRTAIGPYTLDRCVKLDGLPDPLTEAHLLPMDDVPELPSDSAAH